MLTAIYVYEPSTVTILSRRPDERAMIRRYAGRVPDQPALGTTRLEPGIYAILSRGELQIAWEDGRAEALTIDKDEWPDPSLEAGASREQIRGFFDEILKGGEV
jgi:hypothetical protein